MITKAFTPFFGAKAFVIMGGHALHVGGGAAEAIKDRLTGSPVARLGQYPP